MGAAISLLGVWGLFSVVRFRLVIAAAFAGIVII
jgi:hypothetical protein